ncbi:MAG: hypothetical protein QOE95_2421 [Gaiellaceae bacterium]|nr:hypothetical protein [Gaiellaceae bacterium]
MCGYFATKSIWIHVVDESPLAVDLHNREPPPVLSLESRVPADVDLLELEVCLFADLFENRARAFAEVAALRVIQDDPTDKYRA